MPAKKGVQKSKLKKNAASKTSRSKPFAKKKEIGKKTGKPTKRRLALDQDPFVKAVKTIPKGDVWSFQAVAAAAERQGQGGMMRASSIVHQLPHDARDTPWWRVVYKPSAGKPLSKFLQKGNSKRAKAQVELLAKEGVDVETPLLEKALVPDDKLVLRGADLSCVATKSSCAGRRKGVFVDWIARVAAVVAEVVEALGDSVSDKGNFLPIRVANLFTLAEVRVILDWAAEKGNHDRTVRLEKHNFGRGIYHYLSEDAFAGKKHPAERMVGNKLHFLRQELFRGLLPHARKIMPSSFSRSKIRSLKDFHAHCKTVGQARPSSLILYYRVGGVNFAHRDLFGNIAFPFQVLFLLSRPNVDFTGGKFFTMNSKRVKTTHQVNLGDMLIFDPINVTHGMTKITRGRRAVFGFVFHLAK